MKIIDANLSNCPYCGYGYKEEPFAFGLKQETILRGRYLTGRVLGQGGFGITYIGYDLTLDIKVAIKEYFPSGCATRNHTVSNQVQWNTAQFDRATWQAGCDSFLKEARRMAKIDSLPGIVRVRDTFPENQTAYIVMDYIEGETLKQRLQKTGPMRFTECIRLLSPLMVSLDNVHRQGLIHRDISPDNIMIQPDGSVCLLDFGAAKDVSFQQTMASRQVAKKGFSPPEQYREKSSIGPWTDVYALCATIYYCVTGRLVPDAMDRMYDDTLTFDMSLFELLSDAVVSALRDGLKLRSEERIQTVGELLARLQEAGADSSSSAAFGKTAGEEQTASGQTQQSGAAGQQTPAQNRDPAQKDNRPDTVQAVSSEIPQHIEEKGKFSKKAVGAAAAVMAGVLMLAGILAAVTSDADDAAADAYVPQQVPSALEEDETGGILSEVTDSDAADSKKNGSGRKSLSSPPTMLDGGEQERDPVLMQDASGKADEDGIYQGTVLGSRISRADIASVTFLDTLDHAPEITGQQMAAEDMPGAAWDVSWNQDGAVLAWIEQSDAQDGMYDLFIGAQGGVKGEDCTELFAGYVNTVSIDFNESFDTGRVTSMRNMFAECASLTALDVSGFDTGLVTDMSSMFFGCVYLKQLDIYGLDTGAVTDMSYMFCGCSDLQTVDVDGFDTKEVTDMSYMFAYCDSLTELDADHFDLSSLETYTAMFEDSGITARQAGLALEEYILPDSDACYLTKKDLQGLSKEECRIARNEIFARHGRKFDDEELQAYFDSCSWYAGTVAPEDFDDSVLNAYEKANRDLIVEYEQEMGYR